MSRAYRMSSARRRAENRQVQEHRRRALVAMYSGDDPEFNEWLGSLTYAEIVCRHNDGSLRQPSLPDSVRTESTDARPRLGERDTT